MSLPAWMKEIEDKVPENAFKIVVGNKLDGESKRQIQTAEAVKFCEDNKLSYIETSAKNGSNIKKLFEIISCSLIDENIFMNKDKTIIIDQPLKLEESGSKKKCCK
jgi:GTPase SAR1 family protein